MLGLEIEEIKNPFEAIMGVVVGKVLTREAHPDSDHLSCCTVDVGGPQVLPIVCGAANVAAGQLVPVAMVGVSLPGGLTIKKSKIRGQVSEGMICSESELGLAEERSGGILVLPESCRPGQPVVEALGLDTCVLDVSITPNRADCLSVLGIARETAMSVRRERCQRLENQPLCRIVSPGRWLTGGRGKRSVRMSDLIVVGYDAIFKAEDVRLKLLKMQKEYLVDLEDAVVAVKTEDGKVKLNQMYHLTASGAIGGGFWGALIGLIFLNPILGAVVGAGAGAAAGALSDVGINDDFMPFSSTVANTCSLSFLARAA